MRVDCSKCEHCHYPSETCFYDFDKASGAAGQAVDNIHDVYRCRDFSNPLEDESEDD